MFRQILNWKTLLALIGVLIVSGTIFYSQYLARKIAKEEKQKVEQWVEAGKFLISSPADADIRLASMILTENISIPIIETNERDSIITFVNLDSSKAANDLEYVKKKLKQFKSLHAPVDWTAPNDSSLHNRYYYGDSKLLKEVRYYPLIQLCIVALFIIITIFSIRSSFRSTQNQVWAGMAKETAHQLGTPVSSLEGWVEMLKDKSVDQKIVQELEKDVDRLQLVSDRFGKIGSSPHLELTNLVTQVSRMMDYMRKRATGKILFEMKSGKKETIMALVSPPLFDWVIENLLKNALDAMEGKGSIIVTIADEEHKVCIDISDTGKGIARKNIPLLFKPGFTTKKRGWGLGLSLSKRIIEQYHKGEIFVKQSEVGKGTTFRIVLKK
ncbi:MAG: HAMP domain-containing sensor histidine kinase [Chitinophagaceae bacterium]